MKKMPFKSKAQLRTCFSLHPPGWDCKEWLDKTKSVCCLPERVGMPVKTRCMKTGERIVGKVQVGPRGGRYFEIIEKDKAGEVCKVKVYLSNK